MSVRVHRDREERVDEAPAKWPIRTIILLALAARLVAMGYGLPYSFNRQEEKNVKQGFRHTAAYQVDKLKPAKGSRGEPALTPYVLAAEYGALYGLRSLTGSAGSIMEFRHYYLKNPGVFYILGRLASTVFGLLSVYLVYLICTKAFDWGVAVLAAVFMAFSFHNIHFSQIAVSDALAMMFMLGGLYYLVALCTEKRVGSAVYAALMFGFATGAAFEYALFAVLFVVAFALTVPREYDVGATLAGFLLSAVCFAFGALAPNAILAIYFREQLLAGFTSAMMALLEVPRMLLAARSLATLKDFLSFDVFGAGLAPALPAAGILGLLWGVLAAKYMRLRFLIIILALLVPAVFFFPAGAGAFAKYAFFLTPPLAIGAAYFTHRLFWRKGLPAAASVVLIAILAGAIAAPGVLQAGVAAIRSTAGDTRCQYAEWAMENIPDGSRVLVTPEARFLLNRDYLTSASPTWPDWLGKVLAKYNNRSFRLEVIPIPPGDAVVPSPEDFDCVAVDTWSLPHLAGFAEKAEAAGALIKEFPETKRSLSGYGPGITVFRIHKPQEKPEPAAAPPAESQAPEEAPQGD